MYNPPEYWEERHKKYNLDLRGAGHKGLTHEENLKMYMDARQVIKDSFKSDIKGKDLLDIGCGQGFHVDTYLECGCKSYSGIDITDVLLPDLRKIHPEGVFQKVDITSKELPPFVGKFGTITMIDVTQHIVSDTLFFLAMDNIKKLMGEKGIFIVTSWLQEAEQTTEYEKKRMMEEYVDIFEGYRFTVPVEFRDKYIFSVRK